MVKKKLGLVVPLAARLFYVGCFCVVQYAAAGTLSEIMNAFAVVITGAVALAYPPMVAKAGWDWMSSRGTADAKEVPWQRLLIGGFFMLSPAVGVALFNLA